MKTWLLFCTLFLMAVFSQAQIIHVPDDYPTIQQGIYEAENGDTVLVSDGTYYEQINFLGKPITVASEYLVDGDPSHIDNTIIDGSEIPEGDSCSIVYFTNEEDTTSVLCGFTIQHGGGTFHTYSNETRNSGGAIFIYSAGPKIIYNHITDNHLNDTFPGASQTVSGAGIAICGPTDNWIVIDHNNIDYNSCYGITATWSILAGIWVIDHNCIITNNTISSNSTIGEGQCNAGFSAFACYTYSTNVYTVIMHSNVFKNNFTQSERESMSACGQIGYCLGKFTGNLIEDNESVGNISNYWNSGIFEFIDPLPGSFIKGNTFRNNKTYRSGGALGLEINNAQPDLRPVLIEDNYFFGNESSKGGAFYSRNVPVLLQNNVFSGNNSTVSGGAVYFQKNFPSNIPHLLTLINNTFSGNSSNQLGGAISSSSWVCPLIINSIFWNDSSGQAGSEEIFVSYDSLEIAFSDIDTAKIKRLGSHFEFGDGNINEDPLFIDTETLEIDSTSGCFNAGTASFTCFCGVTNNCPRYDILGIERPFDEFFDIGAYEYVFPDGFPSLEDQHVESGIYPNPVNINATIIYNLERSSSVKITIFDSFGRQVGMPANGWQQAGEHQVIFNAENLPAGLYFYRIEAGKMRGSGKMVVVR
jgi:predicted outer membrane repeat protein